MTHDALILELCIYYILTVTSSLIQATLGCLPIQEFGLNQDMQKIFRSASRLCRCKWVCPCVLRHN